MTTDFSTPSFSGNAALRAPSARLPLDGLALDGLPVDGRALLTAFDGSQTVGLCVLNRHHRFVHVNQTFARMIGRAPDDVLGERLAHILSPASIDNARDSLNLVMRGGPAAVSQWVLRSETGCETTLKIESWFIDGRFGRPYLLLLAQPSHVSVPAQPAPAQPAPAQPAPAQPAPSPEAKKKPTLTETAAAALITRTVSSARRTINRLKGEARSAQELSAVRSHEAALASGREKLLHAVLKALPDTVLVLDRAGRIQSVWAPEPVIAGIPVARLHGMRLAQLFPPQHGPRIRNALRKARLGRTAPVVTAELLHRRNGEQRPYMALHFSALRPRGVVVTLRDVTEQQHSRQKLAHQVEQLDGMRRTFIARGRHLTRLADGLNREKRRADRVKATRTHFLATVSHEFRTPLNAILGFAEILHSELLGPVGNPRYRRYARDIVESGNLLLSLVDTVLSYEQAATDRLNLEPDRIDMPDVIGEVLTLFGRWAASMGISLQAEEPPATLVLYADAKALRQMLANLVSNAVKFSEPGGTVWIRVNAGARGAGTVLTVEDRGIGMSKDDIALSMRPFGQVAEHPSGGRSGIGIGLPLTRHLIEEHGGEIAITSTPGEGTQVDLIFPASTAMLPATSG